MYVYKCKYVYAHILDATVPNMFVVWLWTCLDNNLSICTNLGSFNVEKILPLSFDPINDHNFSFHFCLSWIVDIPLLYEAITSFRLLPLSSLAIILSF